LSYFTTSTASTRLHTSYFFFLKSHVPPPDLHSFPTGRSSDVEIYARMSRFLRLPEDELSKLANLQRRERLKKILAEQPTPLREVDRKSTRLNSSHSQISYAVFCLKKKNKTKIHHVNYPIRYLL